MRVAVLGAGRYNVPALRALRDGGFDVLAIDGNPASPGFLVAGDSLVADIRDAAVLRDAVTSRGGVQGIITLGEAGVRSSARVCAELGLPSISEDAAAIVTSKIAMRRVWDAIPQFNVRWRDVHDEPSALAAAQEIGFPVIVKPDRTHGGARGVMRADDVQQLRQAFAFAREAGMSSDVIVEEFIDSISEHSAEVLIHEGGISVIAVGQKIKTPPPFRVDLSVRYPSVLDRARVTGLCQAAIDAAGLTRGVAHIEFALTTAGPKLIELAARCGGGHTPLLAKHAGGVDEIVEAARIACGLAPSKFRPDARRGAEYRFLVFPPGVIREVLIPDEVRSHPNVLDVDILAAPDVLLRAVQAGADRAGFVATFGSDLNEAVRIADWASERILIRYADGAEHRPILPPEMAEVR